MIHPFIQYLQTSRPVSTEEAALLLSSFETRTVKEGTVLFKGGRICHELFFICNGVLRIVVTNDKGITVTHFFLSENQFCTILHSFNNGVPAEEGIEAACEATVLAISKTGLTALYKRLPWLQEIIEKAAHQRLLVKIRTRNVYLGEDSSTRYRLFLDRQPEIASRISLKDTASYLEITPQSLSRIRKSMTRQG